MITDVRYGIEVPPLNPADVPGWELRIISGYPAPIAASVRRIGASKDVFERINLLARDSVPTIFQYVSLLLLAEYARADRPASREILEPAEAMLCRPVSGKYRLFLEALLERWAKESWASRFQPLLAALSDLARPGRVRLRESPLGPWKSMSHLEALVRTRNAWAHAPRLSAPQAEQGFGHAYGLTLAALRRLVFLEQISLRTDAASGYPEAVASGEPLGVDPFLLSRPLPGESADLLLLDELLPETAIYYGASSGTVRETEALQRIRKVMETLRGTEAPVDLDELSTEGLLLRSSRLTARAVDDSRLSGRFDPDAYHVRESLTARTAEFLRQTSQLLLLDGRPGSGKSAWLTHLAHEGIAALLSGDTVVLTLDASRLVPGADRRNVVDAWIQDQLGLARPFLASVAYLAQKRPSPRMKVVILVDALNEFEGGTAAAYGRRELLLDLLDFAATVVPGVDLKVIASLRWDVLRPATGLLESDLLSRAGQALWSAPGGAALLRVEPLSQEEVGATYELTRASGEGRAPSFSWEELRAAQPRVVTRLRTPMHIRIFCTALDGRPLDREAGRTIRRLFTESVIRRDRARRRLVRDLVGTMVTLRATKLPLPAIRDRSPGLYDRIVDRTVDPGSGEPRNVAYRRLEAEGVVFEDVVAGPDGGPVRRLSFADDVVLSFVRSDHSRRETLRDGLGMLSKAGVLLVAGYGLQLAATWLLETFLAVQVGVEAETHRIPRPDIDAMTHCLSEAATGSLTSLVAVLVGGAAGILAAFGVLSLLSRAVHRHLAESRVDLVTLGETHRLLDVERRKSSVASVLMACWAVAWAYRVFEVSGRFEGLLMQPAEVFVRWVTGFLAGGVAFAVLESVVASFTRDGRQRLDVLTSRARLSRRVGDWAVVVAMTVAAGQLLAAAPGFFARLQEERVALYASEWRRLAGEVGSRPDVRGRFAELGATIAAEQGFAEPEDVRDLQYEVSKERAAMFLAPDRVAAEAEVDGVLLRHLAGETLGPLFVRTVAPWLAACGVVDAASLVAIAAIARALGRRSEQRRRKFGVQA